MSETSTLNVTVTGRLAVKVLELIINPALKDWGCVVEWPGYPASHQITVHLSHDDFKSRSEPDAKH